MNFAGRNEVTQCSNSNGTSHQRLDELVMAWGKDTQTGAARYIFELDERRRGGCVCYSCGKPLTAVNAAKVQWQIRPHFRHPDGAERTACLVLTAVPYREHIAWDSKTC